MAQSEDLCPKRGPRPTQPEEHSPDQVLADPASSIHHPIRPSRQADAIYDSDTRNFRRHRALRTSNHFTSGYTMAKTQNALHSKVKKKKTRGNASGRGKATKPKVRYSRRSVASGTTISRKRSPRAAARNSAHKNEVPVNSHIDATVPVTQASEVIGSAARL